MSHDPIQQCASPHEHGAHVWNIYNTSGLALRTVNPEGNRQCNGYTNPVLEATRKALAQTSVALTDAQHTPHWADLTQPAPPPAPVMSMPTPPGLLPIEWAGMSRQQRRAWLRAKAKSPTQVASYGPSYTGPTTK